MDANERIEIKTTSDPANLARARHQVETFCHELGMSDGPCAEVGLCVNEAMANIHRHAYGGAVDKPIHLTARRVEGSIEIQIRDWGNGEAPTELPEWKSDPLKPGGLGLICLNQLLDRVEFAAQSDGMLLTLAKRI